MPELNNMLLSRLLRYHADVEICVRDHDGIDEVAELVRLGLLYPTTDTKTTCNFHALTKLGRDVAGAAIIAARALIVDSIDDSSGSTGISEAIA